VVKKLNPVSTACGKAATDLVGFLVADDADVDSIVGSEDARSAQGCPGRRRNTGSGESSSADSFHCSSLPDKSIDDHDRLKAESQTSLWLIEYSISVFLTAYVGARFRFALSIFRFG